MKMNSKKWATSPIIFFDDKQARASDMVKKRQYQNGSFIMTESHPDFFFETVDETPKNGTRGI